VAEGLLKKMLEEGQAMTSAMTPTIITVEDRAGTGKDANDEPFCCAGLLSDESLKVSEHY